MPNLFINRRQILTRIAAISAAMGCGMALAAQPVVEIIAFAHPPVQSSLKTLRDWLATQGSKIRVVEIDMESGEAKKRLESLGLKGHIPIVVLVDGQYKQVRKDASVVELVNFPQGPGTPTGAKGGWSAADVQAVLAKIL